MKTEERRRKIKELLNSKVPQTGNNLAEILGVSRQVIVQDIAVLRAAGVEILATPQGYLLPGSSDCFKRTFACRHDLEGLEKELILMVDYGGKVIDVSIEHPMYGELRGYLMLSSRYDVQKYVRDLQNSGAQPLYTLTDSGVHLHTVEASSRQILDNIESALAKEGFLLE
ncbi:MAG: uncharacterized protein PWP31_588 [Clostridia bacterium]|nr:uncharacterized protein [Clostridia bacterium]